jgi:hypothetical protein
MATRLKRSKRKRKLSEATRIIRIAVRVQKQNLRRLDRAQAGGEVIKRSLMFSRLAKNRSSVREHIHRFLSLSPSRFWLTSGRTLHRQPAPDTSSLPYRALPTEGQINPKMCFKVLARAENRSDDPGCIHRLLSRSLFFGFRDRLRSAPDRTPYHQQPLGTSLVPWSYPYRVGCELSDLIVACDYGERQ